MEKLEDENEETGMDILHQDGYQRRADFTPIPPVKEIKDVVKEHVLPYLPAKTLTRFRSVSKDWDDWIRSPFLAYLQSYTYRDLSGFFCQSDYEDPTFLTLDPSAYGVPTPSLEFLPQAPLVDIRSSSGGLLLCEANNLYYICNPVTKKFMELNEPRFYHGSRPAILLALEPSVLNIAADYEVICAFLLNDGPIVRFEQFSSQTMSWESSEEWWIGLEGESNRFTGDGFYMKGMAYWLLTCSSSSCCKVLAFDLKDKFLDVVCLPDDSPRDGILANIQDELHYIGISTEYNDSSILIYGGPTLTLKRSIDLNLFHRYRLLPCIHSNEVMILMDNSIYSYRLRDLRFESESCRGVQGVDSLATTRFLPYVNTLVSVAWV